MHGMFSALRREVFEGREEIKSLREALVIISNQKRDEANDSGFGWCASKCKWRCKGWQAYPPIDEGKEKMQILT